MSTLEVVFSGSKHTLYCASVNLSSPSRHQTPNPSLTFSPVPVCWFRICLMTWFPKAKKIARRASTFTSQGILKMSQFLFTTFCYRLGLILGLRWIYLENCFSRENVSAKLILWFFKSQVRVIVVCSQTSCSCFASSCFSSCARAVVEKRCFSFAPPMPSPRHY